MYLNFSRVFFFTCCVLFSVHPAFASIPPVNDEQCTPTILTMTNPNPCPSWDMDSVIITGNNIGATTDTLQPMLMDCQVGTSMPITSPDVWYKFMATAEHMSVTMSGLQTNVMALYLKHEHCRALLPINCGVVAGAPLTLFFENMIPGEYYYLQVGGGTSTDVGSFTLTFNWVHPCDECIQKSKLIAFPPPVHGYYHPGDTVIFAYVVEGYKAYGQDHFHGISPSFGPGWDITSLTTSIVSPPSPASGQGSWDWYNNVMDESGNPVSGFFYDGPPLINNNPADNEGDQGDQYSQWIFYWRIRAKPAPPCTGPQDLSVYINNYSDYQTGSGTNPSCKNDPDYTFKATLDCCDSPAMIISDATCSNSPDGSVLINVIPTPGPYSCVVYDESGNLVYSFQNSVSSLFAVNNLPQGNYVTITRDGSGCFSSRAFRVSSEMDLMGFQTNFSCGSNCNNQAMILGQTNGNYTYQWTPSNQTSNIANNLCQGIYTVTVSNTTIGCTDTLFIPVVSYPPDDGYFEYSPPNGTAYCTIDTTIPKPSYVATPGGNFSWNGPGSNFDPFTGAISLLPPINAGTYTVTYTTPGPCQTTFQQQVTFNQSPPIPTVGTVSDICENNQPMTLNANPLPIYTVIWDDTTDSFLPYFGNPYTLPILSAGPHTYLVVYYDFTTQCASLPAVVQFDVLPSPVASAGPDDTTCVGFQISLNGSGGITYLWSPPNGLSDANTANPLASPDSTTTYLLTVIDQNGCTDYDSVTVFVEQTGDCDIEIYNGFSPNGDQFNDYWHIEGITNFPNKVLIYNRWGDLVWNRNDYNNRDVIWQGNNNHEQELPAGTYFYVIILDQRINRGWVEITR